MNNFYEDETYNEYSDSDVASFDDNSDDETELLDILYEPEEQSLTKYNIVLCGQYDEYKHGIFSGVINNHYLTFVRLKELDIDYINFVKQYDSVRVEIAECLYLPSQHCISIIKTHWLKLIQRTWKKICRDRKLTIIKRCHPKALKYREIHGKWPNNCINYPSSRGMLSKLSRTFSGTSP